MKVYSTRNAMKAFYFLTAIDGDIDNIELQRFYEIGNQLDGEHFDSYKDELVIECQKQLSAKDADAEYYDVLQEAVDAILCESNCEDSIVITPRLLLWNLLAVAFSNNNYDKSEKRIIAHVARISGVDKSILLEMEQYIETAKAIRSENEYIQRMNRPYAEIRPIVDELEKRMRVIKDSAQALIEDEVTLDSAFVYEPDLFDKTKSAFDEAVLPVAHKVGDKAKETTESVVNKLSPVAKQVKDKTQGLFNKISSKIPGKKDKQNKEDM